MCGIVGYLGSKQKGSFLIDKLKRLEYRGYDSSGIANNEFGTIKIFKECGNISNLEKVVPEDFEITCSMAQTRWATHGVASRDNAHPHMSHDGEWAIVHNGIIENYDRIKTCLKHKPNGETDTAVIAEFLSETNVSDFKGFVESFQHVVGSFAIVAINKNYNDMLFVTKQKSPLYICKNKECDVMVASDPICFSGFGDECYILNDGEFAQITHSCIDFRNTNFEKIQKQPECVDVGYSMASSQGYKHFMLKEIMEQPQSISKQIQVFKEQNVFKKIIEKIRGKFEKVKFIGCGTAYHAGLVGARYFSKILKVQASAEIASEFIYSQPVLADEKTLFVFISQSGETADTLKAVDMAKQLGATTVALTNVLYSSIARSSEFVLPVCAGPEIAVASTKAYTCQLSALYLFANALNDFDNLEKYYNEILNLSKNLLNFDKCKLDDVAKKLSLRNDVVFIGKDIDYVTAMEASLKLKEVAYINSASYPSGELKHGYLAIIEKHTPLIVFASQTDINIKSINAASEAVSRGADPIFVTNDCCFRYGDFCVIELKQSNDMLSAISSIVPMQYLAYKTSVIKGLNPDQPRNLAKSVTVE